MNIIKLQQCYYKRTHKNQSIREKSGVQTIVREIEQYQQEWLQQRECRKTGYQSTYCSINLKGEEI